MSRSSGEVIGDGDHPLGGSGAWMVVVRGKRLLPGRTLRILHDVVGWNPFPAELASMGATQLPVARMSSRSAAEELVATLEETGLDAELTTARDDHLVVLDGPLNERQLERAIRRLSWVPGLEDGVDYDGDYPVSDVPLADDYPEALAQAMVAVLRSRNVVATLIGPDDGDDDDVEWCDLVAEALDAVDDLDALAGLSDAAATGLVDDAEVADALRVLADRFDDPSTTD
ncbi:MAG: hypothetical protein JJU45_00310 [Acidimicrobiia bacterium]|nr:hypothetical protein [Acidimicrobiia bacterium]